MLQEKPVIKATHSKSDSKRYRGIEPLTSVWKTEVIPFYEYRKKKNESLQMYTFKG